MAENKRFFLTGLLIQWSLAAAVPTQFIWLGDAQGSGVYSLNKGFSHYFGISTSGSIFLDFSSSPIEFNNKIGWGIGMFPALALGNYCSYCAFGFEEIL